MSNESLKRRLEALANASQRTAIERMRDVLPQIEAAIDAGASRKQIVEALNEEGIEVTLTVFSTYLTRLRYQARQGSAANEPGNDASNQVKPQSTSESPPQPTKSRKVGS